SQEEFESAQQSLLRIRSEISKAVVGQDQAVTGLIIALVAGEHALIEGVPGVAKTLLMRSLAAAVDLEMTRVQFTPDLMPADITGSMVWNGK
ncbi:UNVERIFIED_CONTAM: MoxR family ATPase, partial [Bacillus sp. ATCC 13368]